MTDLENAGIAAGARSELRADFGEEFVVDLALLNVIVGGMVVALLFMMASNLAQQFLLSFATVRIDGIELVGAESLIHGRLQNGDELVFRVSGRARNEIGDEVKVRAPGGVRTYEILEVHW